MFSRLLNRQKTTRPVVARQFVEGLENRQMLAAAPIITNVIADNRGEVQITASRFLRGVNKNSVRFFTAGADGTIGTADDIRKTDISVSFNASNNRVTVRGNTESNATYRVRLESTLITSGDNRRLDGEFLGTLPTGNGTQGGNFNFVARRDRSSTPRVRVATTEGTIILRMRGDLTPTHAQNFLDYANSGRYDNVFFTRSENNPAPFVIQGGSLQITGDGQEAGDIIATTRFAAILDENDLPGALSNTIGTLSFAKGGPDDATNQFFINLADNSFLDSPQRSDGGFTVFAEVTSGIAAAQAINQKPVANLQSQIGTVASSTNTGVTNVPVENQGQAEAGLNPLRDLPYIRRVAGQMKIGALA